MQLIPVRDLMCQVCRVSGNLEIISNDKRIEI